AQVLRARLSSHPSAPGCETDRSWRFLDCGLRLPHGVACGMGKNLVSFNPAPGRLGFLRLHFSDSPPPRFIPPNSSAPGLWKGGPAAEPLVQARRRAGEMRAADGHRGWNQWAAAMLALRQRLQHDAPSLQVWRETATADFAGQILRGQCIFAEFVFPGPVDFS